MKYNKGFAPLILVAIIVGALVIGGGAYYLGKSKGENKKVGENINVENQGIDNSKDTNITKNDVTNQPAYLKSVYIKDGKNYIDVDYVQMFATADERIKAMIEDKVCLNVKDCYDFPNGYKRNANPLIRTFEVNPSVLINVHGIFNQSLNKGNFNSANSVISFGQLLNFTSKDSIKEHYIKIDVKDGKVVKIIEPYQE